MVGVVVESPLLSVKVGEGYIFYRRDIVKTNTFEVRSIGDDWAISGVAIKDMSLEQLTHVQMLLGSGNRTYPAGLMAQFHKRVMEIHFPGSTMKQEEVKPVTQTCLSEPTVRAGFPKVLDALDAPFTEVAPGVWLYGETLITDLSIQTLTNLTHTHNVFRTPRLNDFITAVVKVLDAKRTELQTNHAVNNPEVRPTAPFPSGHWAATVPPYLYSEPKRKTNEEVTLTLTRNKVIDEMYEQGLIYHSFVIQGVCVTKHNGHFTVRLNDGSGPTGLMSFSNVVDYVLGMSALSR